MMDSVKTNAIKTIIVDDEPLARKLLTSLLKDHPFEIIAEHSNASDVLAFLDNDGLQPEVVFIDINMPQVTGLELAQRIKSLDTVVVFVTAHPQHALAAFNVKAFDYVLKPINKERFEETLARIQDKVEEKRLLMQMRNYSEESSSPPSINSLFPLEVKSGADLEYLMPEDIDWLEAMNQYLMIHSTKGNFMFSTESLSSVFQALDSNRFVQVHRGAVVNVSRIANIRQQEHGLIHLMLQNGDVVKVSRRSKQKLKDIVKSQF